MKKAELAAPTGTSSGPCTTTVTVFGPAPAVLEPDEPPDEAAAAGDLCYSTFGEKQAEVCLELASLGKPPPREGTGGCILNSLDFSPPSMCAFVHVDKGRKGTATAGKKAGCVQFLHKSLSISIWKLLPWTQSLKESFTQHTASAVVGG